MGRHMGSITRDLQRIYMGFSILGLELQGCGFHGIGLQAYYRGLNNTYAILGVPYYIV